jgi:hypothetical protein
VSGTSPFILQINGNVYPCYKAFWTGMRSDQVLLDRFDKKVEAK